MTMASIVSGNSTLYFIQALLVIVFVRVAHCSLSLNSQSKWNRRNLLNAFSSLHGGCQQGPQQETTQETVLNHPDYWEKSWGRSDAGWPRRGFQSCWSKRGKTCALPNQNHVVCLPGSKKGSTVNRGWALDPKSQACKPGVHCLYACEPGYYWTTFNNGETSNFDFANAHKRGNCDGTWDYGTSTHGVYCKKDGTLALPSKPLCAMGETFVYAENRLDKHIFLCQTVFPGHEIFMIPTLVKPGETVMITTQPLSGWSGPTWNVPPKADIYVSFAGADIMEACTWDEISPSGASLLPYEIGSGVDDNGYMYSSHFFFQQPNSEVPSYMVGYTMDIECESSVEGVCTKRMMQGNLISVSTMKKPPPGTKIKYVFNKPGKDPEMGAVYKEPNKAHLPNPMSITGLKANAGGGNQYKVSTYGGRKLLSVVETKSFLENTLFVPIVVCGTENGEYAPGMSVGPGEKVQLPKEGTFLIGLKGDSWYACQDMSNLPWILTIGTKNSTSGMEEFSFNYDPSILQNQGQQLTYNMNIKCISVNDECLSVDERHVSIPLNKEATLAEEEDINSPEITFVVGKLGTSETTATLVGTYHWANHLLNFITKLKSFIPKA